MAARFNRLFRAILLVSRWSMLPLTFGLVVALLIEIVQFFRELAHAVGGFAAMDDGAVILAVLKLVDLTLVANLVIMIIGAAVEIVLPHGREDPAERRGEVVDFGVIKLRLFASASAIAAIYLLERFINIRPADKSEILWEILILLSFAVSGVLLAWMDRLTADRH
jgi:uncharacterized protein (TIGR00645 family)